MGLLHPERRKEELRMLAFSGAIRNEKILLPTPNNLALAGEVLLPERYSTHGLDNSIPFSAHFNGGEVEIV